MARRGHDGGRDEANVKSGAWHGVATTCGHGGEEGGFGVALTGIGEVVGPAKRASTSNDPQRSASISNDQHRVGAEGAAEQASVRGAGRGAYMAWCSE